MEKRKMKAEEILRVLEESEYKEVVKALLIFEGDYDEETFEEVYDEFLDNDSITKLTQIDTLFEDIY